jgi:putative phosphoribosyl transferase
LATLLADVGRVVSDRLERLLPKHLAVVPGATHLFEEPGTPEQVARLASDWFQRYLVDRG